MKALRYGALTILLLPSAGSLKRSPHTNRILVLQGKSLSERGI